MTLHLSDAAGIATSCTVSENLRENNAGSFCGDSELLLDRMIEQCQTRPVARHPGFGRKLIPYFNDASDSPVENPPKQKLEGSYIRGASQGCGSGGGNGGYNKRTSPRSCRRGGMGSRAYSHATEEVRNRRSRVRERHLGGHSVASVTLLSKKNDHCDEGTYAFQPTSVCSLFAGPICFNSPPPEALPMPTAVLLAKAMCLS